MACLSAALPTLRPTTRWASYAGVFADKGISGTKTNRPEFQRLLQECEAGRIDIVLTKSISRFGRNTVDVLKTIRHLKELGVEVQFEEEHISSLDEGGELLLTLLASFAQEESYSIYENCKWGIRKRFEEGLPRNCKIYGYRVVDEKLSIKEDEAEVVRRVFRMFLAGDSCYAISQQFAREGIMSYHGKAINGVVIQRMLRQEKYTGCILCQKYYVENHITHNEKKNNGELPMYFVEGTHPAIISMETFQAAQEEFARRYGLRIINGIVERASYLKHDGVSGKPDPPHRKAYWSAELRRRQSETLRNSENVDNAYPFSRFIRCEGCNAHLWGQRRYFVDRTVDIRWECGHHSKNAPGTPRPVSLRDNALREQIAKAMEMTAFDEEAMHQQLEYISFLVSRITLHYKDGSTRSFDYEQPKQKKRKRKDGNG